MLHKETGIMLMLHHLKWTTGMVIRTTIKVVACKVVILLIKVDIKTHNNHRIFSQDSHQWVEAVWNMECSNLHSTRWILKTSQEVLKVEWIISQVIHITTTLWVVVNHQILEVDITTQAWWFHRCQIPWE